jgi:hypothetical protein
VSTVGRVLVRLTADARLREKDRLRHSASQPEPLESQSEPSDLGGSPFHCDRRAYCSQMTSCAESKYFLTRCPDVKMDGDHDGIPCEKQWCPGGQPQGGARSLNFTVLGGSVDGSSPHCDCL